MKASLCVCMYVDGCVWMYWRKGRTLKQNGSRDHVMVGA